MSRQSVSFGMPAVQPKEVVLTDSAAEKVRRLKNDESNENLKLRVYITGGGCSGFQYGFKFDEEVKDDDLVVENADVTMLIDSMSLRYLDGAEVDYEAGLEGERFFINNPNAATTCGCGSSFSV